MSLNFNDFQKQDIKFDINELKKAYQEILKIKDFDAYIFNDKRSFAANNLKLNSNLISIKPS